MGKNMENEMETANICVGPSSQDMGNAVRLRVHIVCG